MTRRLLLTIAGAVVLLGLVAMAVLLFADVNRFKPRLEAAASDALGMGVRFDGRLGIALFPSFHVSVEDGHILGEHGVDVASAKRVSLWIELLPLLRREFRLRRIELSRPTLSIERDREGRVNVERLKKVAVLLAALDDASVSLSDGKLLYLDRRSGEAFEATDFDLAVSHIRLAGKGNPQAWKDLSLKAELACGEIRTRRLSVSALKVLVDGKDGVFELKPITMRVFGGRAAGSILADLSGPIPLGQVRCSLPRFRIEEFLKTLSPKQAAEGAMDFSSSLSMRGRTTSEMVRSAAGVMSLRGENLVLEGTDLDHALSRFESSQNFKLVDVGAVFFAGPMGLAVTRGYDFGSLFRGSGGNAKISTLVSNWKVERGVAQARDVAMATAKNRIALQGGLDFVNGQFADVTVAVIDAKGCARVRQAIHGSFANPVVEKPRVLKSLAAPVLKLYRRARGVFPAAPCEPFYSGSVAAPR